MEPEDKSAEVAMSALRQQLDVTTRERDRFRSEAQELGTRVQRLSAEVADLTGRLSRMKGAIAISIAGAVALLFGTKRRSR